MDVASVLNRALDVRIPIQENGRRRIITMREAIIRGLVNDAARREPKAMRMLFALMTRHPGDAGALHTGALATEDQAILADFLAKYSTPGAQKNHLAGPEDAPDLIQTDGDDGGS